MVTRKEGRRKTKPTIIIQQDEKKKQDAVWGLQFFMSIFGSAGKDSPIGACARCPGASIMVNKMLAALLSDTQDAGQRSN